MAIMHKHIFPTLASAVKPSSDVLVGKEVFAMDCIKIEWNKGFTCLPFPDYPSDINFYNGTTLQITGNAQLLKQYIKIL